MPSLRSRLLDVALRASIKRRLQRLHRIDVATARASRARLDALLPFVPRPPPGTVVEASARGEPAGEWIRPPGAVPGRTLLYLHGGAYALGSPALYRGLTCALARCGRCAVFVPDYRLAPEHPFPAAVDDARAAWRWMLERGAGPERCAVAGDSAGGGLALALLLVARDAGIPLPATGVCLSPWVDLTASGESVRANAARDPYIVARLLRPVAHAYLDGGDPHDPLASPLWADLAGLPPLLIQVSDAEVLLSDAERLAARCRAAGVDATLEIHPDMAHVFQLFFPLIPEARSAIRRIGRHLESHLGARGYTGTGDHPPTPGVGRS